MEEAIEIWEQILDKFRKSKVAEEHHAVPEMLVYMNYPGTLEVCGYLDRAEKAGIRGIEMAMKCQSGDAAAVILANLSCVYEKRDTQEDAGLCEQCLRNSYLLLQVYGYEKKSKILKDAYSKKYGKSLN